MSTGSSLTNIVRITGTASGRGCAGAGARQRGAARSCPRAPRAAPAARRDTAARGEPACASALGPSAATHTGGCGFCTGCGLHVARPTSPTIGSPAHAARIPASAFREAARAWRCASPGRPRTARSTKPRPTPRITRPPESWSSTATCAAACSGWRSGQQVRWWCQGECGALPWPPRPAASAVRGWRRAAEVMSRAARTMRSRAVRREAPGWRASRRRPRAGSATGCSPGEGDSFQNDDPGCCRNASSSAVDARPRIALRCG